MSRTTKVTINHTLDKEEFQDMIRSTFGLRPDQQFEASVYVPGGGDWSSTTLEIPEVAPLKIRWEETLDGDYKPPVPMRFTEDEQHALRLMINRVRLAVAAHEMRGCGDPEDVDYIEGELIEADIALEVYIGGAA